MADLFNIAGRINSTSEEAVAAVASQILDETQNKKQSEVNEETATTLASHDSTITGLNSQNYVSVTASAGTTAVTDVLPATGAVNTVYRVGKWDGTQYDATVYSEYSWSNNAYVLLDVKSYGIDEEPTPGSENVVKSGGIASNIVFDVTAANSGATFADLNALLTDANLNTLIPVSVRKGGMSIKFIQGSVGSSDNNSVHKYVQARCMAQNFTTDVTQWQGVDDEPIAGSKNLVESGGVAKNAIIAQLNIHGDNNNLVYIGPYNVLPNHKYRLYFINKDVSMTGVISGYRFLVNDSNDVQTPIYQLDQSLSLPDYADIDIPDEVTEIYVAGKCASGSVLKVCLIDITINKLDYRNYKSTYSINGCLNTSTGLVFSFDNFVITDFIRVFDNNTIDFACYYNTTAISGYPVGGGLCCYDKYKRFISAYTTGTVENRVLKGTCSLSDLPSDTVYIRLCKHKELEGYIYGIADYDEDGLGIGFWFMPKNPAYPKSFIYSTSMNQIGAALEVLHTLGGGTILLKNCTYQGAPIIIGYDDVEIKGTSSAATVLKSTSPSNKYEFSVTTSNACISNLSCSAINITVRDNSVLLENVLLNGELMSGELYSYRMIASSDSSEEDKANAEETIDTNDNAASRINQLLGIYRNIILLEGTYNLTSGITISQSNSSIIGKGTVNINRPSGFTIFTKTAVTNSYVENVRCSGNIHLTNNGATCGEIKNCYMGTSEIKNLKLGYSGITNITLGKDIFVLDTIKHLLYISRPNDSVRYRLLVLGKNTVPLNTVQMVFEYTLDMEGIGDDAEIEFTGDYATSGIWFRDSAGGDINYSVIKNIKFTRTGYAGGYQYAAVVIKGSHLTFENCTFENKMKYASAYDPSTDIINTPVAGDRKHGCLFEIDDLDNCETTLRNCVGIGSPYGHKNCRGFYIFSGTPRLYNCKGIGGGVGMFGHGIICHGASKPFLYNCIGIGSPYGYTQCDGFRLQSNSQAHLYNCTGYGSTGYRHTLDSDGELVPSNVLTTKSRGFSSNYHVTAVLNGCIGYAGDGEESAGIATEHTSSPIITGGYFGKEDKAICVNFAKDSGQTYMTIPLGNKDRAIELMRATTRVLNIQQGQKVVLKSNGTIIGETVGISGEAEFNLTTVDIPANTVITCSVVDSNYDDIDYSGTFQIVITWEVANNMVLCDLQNSSAPIISGATFKGNKNSDGILDNTDGYYLISNCYINVRNDKYAILSNIQKNAVRVANCVLTSTLTHNVNGYISSQNMGTNVGIN